MQPSLFLMRRWWGGLVFWLSVLLVGVPQPVQAQVDFSAAEKIITDSLAQGGRGCGLLVVGLDSVLHTRYWGGYTDTTTLPIGSVSGLLSSLAIANTGGQVQASLFDETVQAHLPSFAHLPTMTLRQLLGHTAGLPEDSPYLHDSTLSLAQSVDSIGTHIAMASAPGIAFRYSKVGLQVAARLVEVAAQTAWPTLFANRLTQSLGLGHTGYPTGAANAAHIRIADGARASMPDLGAVLRHLMRDDFEVANSSIPFLVPTTELLRDQTDGLPLVATPYAGDSLRQALRHGWGVWLDGLEPLTQINTQFTSQGQNGLTVWFDRCRQIAVVLFVDSTLPNVQPTHTLLRATIDSIVPAITFAGGFYYINEPNFNAHCLCISGDTKITTTERNWWYKDGERLTIHENTSFPLSTDPSDEGTYVLEGINQMGCPIRSEYTYRIASRATPAVLGALTLAPNPTSGAFTVSGAFSPQAPTQMQITDVLGRALYATQLDKPSTALQPDLPAGVYLVRFVHPTGATHTQRLVVQ